MRKAALLALSALVAVSPTTAVADPDVQHIRVTRGGQGSGGTTLALSLNKAAIVDLPADARDVMLSNPEIADAVVRTPRRIYVLGRKVGQTNAFFFDAAGRQVANVEINVEPDVAPLNDLFRRYVPNTNASAEAVNGSLVLSGSVKSAAEAERVLQIANRFAQSQSAGGAGGGAAAGGASANQQIVNLIAVEGQEQVLVKVRIVEMSRTLVRQLGVNINAENILNQLLPEDTFVRVATQNGYSIAGRALGGASISGGVAETILQPQSLAFGSLGGLAGSNDQRFGTAGAIDPRLAGTVGYSYTPAINGTPESYTFGPAKAVSENQVDASIDAFERVGLLRVLAEPNLTAISGEAAKFLAGGEFPVPVPNGQGDITIQYKPFGVTLKFTPGVQDSGLVRLKVSPEVSQLDTSAGLRLSGTEVPGLLVRRAATTIELKDGETFAIAGLFQQGYSTSVRQIPWAGDVPVLGSLFRSRDYLAGDTEMVVLVTAYLVDPNNPDAFQTPADGLRFANDAETILFGKLNKTVQAPPGANAGRTWQGPIGYVIE